MTQEERKLYDAANEYAWNIESGDLNTNRDSFIAGAQWQYEQFENNRLAACDNMTKEEFEREQEFVTDFIEKNHHVPTYSDAIEYGRNQVVLKLESLCKEWHLHTSAEAKYRKEAYKELIEKLKKEWI